MKIAILNDTHAGIRNSSDIFMDYQERFYSEIFFPYLLENNIKQIIHLGDYYDNRKTVNFKALNHNRKVFLDRLREFGITMDIIPGNHDLYYRDKRDVTGVAWAKHLKNINICNDWFEDQDVIIAPWLVGDDYKKIQKMSAQYMFGHFELPHFKMNAMVEMPDHGELKGEHFGHYDKVFSGHFHLRQEKNNINYIGNSFPHNFADASDDQRGCMILDWGNEPEYHAWPDQPLYKVLDLSTVIDQADTILKPKMHVRINLDIDISYEEANYIKEKFISDYNLREMALIPNKRGALEDDAFAGEIHFESVAQIVTDQITSIDSEFYDNKLLLDIYRNL